jgi:hypothetical protein
MDNRTTQRDWTTFFADKSDAYQKQWKELFTDYILKYSEDDVIDELWQDDGAKPTPKNVIELYKEMARLAMDKSWVEPEPEPVKVEPKKVKKKVESKRVAKSVDCCQARLIVINTGDKRHKGQKCYPNIRCKNVCVDGKLYCAKCDKQKNSGINFGGNIFEDPVDEVFDRISYEKSNGKGEMRRKLCFYGTKPLEGLSMPKPDEKFKNRWFMSRDELPWLDRMCKKYKVEIE